MATISFRDKLARMTSVAPAGISRGPPQASLANARPSAPPPAAEGQPTDAVLSRLGGRRPGPSDLRRMLETLAERHARRAAAERVETARRLGSAAEALVAARGEGADGGPARAVTARAWAESSVDRGLRLLRYELEPDHCHGRVPLSRGLRVDGGAVAELALDPSLAPVDLSRMLYLDTETTGLSLGGGTVPFLVGLAFAVDGALVVEQLFLDDLGGEEALLNHLSTRMAEASGLVTYNGKAFDWPLITTRYVLNRVSPPVNRPHLDLLALARRVYRPRLGSVRLVQMEAEVLGHRREYDIDGAEIPGTYWAFQRHGVGEAVLPILEHNFQDVVALVALQGELGDRYAELRVEDDPTDQWARARVAFRAQAFDRALSFAHAALDGGAAPDVAGRAALLAATVHRKEGRFMEAAQVLEAALADLTPGTLEMAQVRLALAKLCEHRLKDLSRALFHARTTELAEGRELSERRRRRLERRLQRQRGEPVR